MNELILIRNNLSLKLVNRHYFPLDILLVLLSQQFILLKFTSKHILQIDQMSFGH